MRNASPISDGAVATYDAAVSSAAGHVLVFDYAVGANDHSDPVSPQDPLYYAPRSARGMADPVRGLDPAVLLETAEGPVPMHETPNMGFAVMTRMPSFTKSPHETSGGCTPNPRNERNASNSITLGIVSVR